MNNVKTIVISFNCTRRCTTHLQMRAQIQGNCVAKTNSYLNYLNFNLVPKLSDFSCEDKLNEINLIK
jgi:hypothetical protein